MLPINSSSALRPALLLSALLCACTTTPPGAAQRPGQSGTVGYVRMEDLVKRHPLYSTLAKIDDDMTALQLRSVGSGPSLAPADLRREQQQLQKELQAASERANAALKLKQEEYAKRENEAIRQALMAAGGAAGPGAQAIGGGIDANAQRQLQAAQTTAIKNLDTYKRQVIAQDEASLRALQDSLNASAARQYHTKFESLQKKEADYALQLASENSAERLSLRTKLSNLVLDESQRADARKALDALDHKEADALAALKNRDAATLAAYQKQLRDESQAELARQSAGMRKGTLAKINRRELETRTQLAQKMSIPALPHKGSALAGLTPGMRARIEDLHKKYQQDFTKDAKATIEQFRTTQRQLSERYAKMQGVDANAIQGAQAQMNVLQKQRDELYDQMVAQIGREVKAIAARRGINVVVSAVAPANGVDLTPDAEKDIESLHE